MPYKNIEARREAWRKSYRKHREARIAKRREKHYADVYGITMSEWSVMNEQQKGLCEICKNPASVGKSAEFGEFRLDVDHDHERGTIRSLLCRSCNLAIGHAKDNASLLRLMAEYLDKHSTK